LPLYGVDRGNQRHSFASPQWIDSNFSFPLLTAADAVWACGPHEGFGVGVGLGNEAVDGVFKVGDGSKHAAFEAPICELGEEAFDGIEP